MLWTSDPKITELKDAVNPILLASKKDRQWSLAELKLSASDIIWLETWFKHLPPDINKHDDFILYFGALFLCLGSELCREHSTEDSVWPTFRRIIPQIHPLHNLLFVSNGQPSKTTRSLIEIATHSLNLRHALEIEDAQQWFVTIKLQYGFTYRGAKARLAEWLVGLGCPHAVQYLRGESNLEKLSSRSFIALWDDLKKLRNGKIKESQARLSLQKNPWVKDHWIDALLIEAQSKIDTLGSSSWTGYTQKDQEEECQQEEMCPIENIELEWNPNSPPRLFFLLNKEGISAELSETIHKELDFYIDGRKLRRWLLQPDGSWSGDCRIPAEPDSQAKMPNLSPKILTVTSRTGDLLYQWDFADSGLSADVLVFDLDRSRMVNFGHERLDRNKHYALICDRTCNLNECTPVEQPFKRDSLPCQVFRLPVPLEQSLSVAYQDFLLWQPVRDEDLLRPTYSLSLKTSTEEVFSLNDQTILYIEGLPEESTNVKLLIHKNIHSMVQQEKLWQTERKITLTPELTAKQRRVRVRFCLNGRQYTVEPKLMFNLLGIAMIHFKKDSDHETFTLEKINKGGVVNKTEGSSYLRVWSPSKQPVLFEAEYRVGLVRQSKIKLRDLPGFGGELSIMAGPAFRPLDITCNAKGYIRDFTPQMFNNPAKIFLMPHARDLDLNDPGYTLFEWVKESGFKAYIKEIPKNKIRIKNGLEWHLDCSLDIMAVVLAYKTRWCGAWWSLEKICEYLRAKDILSLNDYLTLKQLRVPIFSQIIDSSLRKAINKTPMQFINVWRSNHDISMDSITYDEGFDYEYVLRHFLWIDFPLAFVKEARKILGSCNSRFNPENCSSHLSRLTEISPILFWKSIEDECSKKCKSTFQALLQRYILDQLHLQADAEESYIKSRLKRLKENALVSSCMDENEMDHLIKILLQYIKRPSEYKLPEYAKTSLQRMAGSFSCRKYLSSRLADFYLNAVN